jgi:hypothetical protein
MRLRVALVLALLVGAMVPILRAEANPTDPPAPPACSPADRPETGLQGDVPLADQLSGRADDGYNCGLSVVGYNPLDGRGDNANMAWVDDCAYITGAGVAVVDVSDPSNPVYVRTLHGPGSTDTLETIHAVRSGDRAVLVAGRYGLFATGGDATGPVDIYDVSQDCTDPQLVTTFEFPRNVHNLTLTSDAMQLWSTLPTQVADISDLANPRYLGNIDGELRAAAAPLQLQFAHEVWPIDGGDRIVVGGQVLQDERMFLVDVEDWPNRPLEVISSWIGPGHSVRTARVRGHDYVLHSEESVLDPTALGCLPSALTPFAGAAQPRLTDVENRTRPRTVSTLELEINDPLNCVTQASSGVDASSHYHDVDDPDDTTFAMVSMWHAGLRIFDLRHPEAPTEVAYFNPGRFRSPDADPVQATLTRDGLDIAWGHVHYHRETGHIWLATQTGGFWVLELAPQVREHLDLPERPSLHPDGTAPRPESSHLVVQNVELGGIYCTLAPVQSTLTAVLGAVAGT